MKNSYNLTMVFFVLVSSLSFAQNFDKNIEFTSLSEALKNPDKVIRLNLSNQKINIANTDWAKFINLEYLSLKNDHLKEIPIGVTKIVSLKTIDLSGNDFVKLPDDFTNLINLEELYLNDEKNIDLPKTLFVLSKLPKIKSLHLENDNLSILPSELSLFKNLESLYLNKNKFKDVPKLDALDHLKYLDLKDNDIKPEFRDMKNLNFGLKINF